MALLAGMVFFVFNMGDQLNRRVETQNAADAAATAGAGWMARSMNLVAMNNVTQSRLIALAIVLDSIPLAAEMSVAEHTGAESLTRVLANQLSAGLPATRGDFLAAGLRYIHEQMGPQTDAIWIVDQAFDQRDERAAEGGGSFNVDQATVWPNGSIWRAAQALDSLSRTLHETSGVLAADAAARFGRANGADTTVLLPVLPPMPARRGHFEDFMPLFTDHLEVVNSPSHNLYSRNVVASDFLDRIARSTDLPRDIVYMGRRRWYDPAYFIAGGAIPDYAWPQRLGPFASVYHWRDAATVRGQNWGVTGFASDHIGYRTYGPLENALRNVLQGFGEMGAWDDTSQVAWTLRFPFHVRNIAKLKLAYMLGLDAPRQLAYPSRWITNFEEANKFATEHPDEVAGMRYYRINVDSKVSWDDPGWMDGEATDPETRTWFSWQLGPPVDRQAGESDEQWAQRQPLVRWAHDPWTARSRRYRWWEPPGQKVGNDVWVNRRQRQVRSYEYFNWLERPLRDDDGNLTGYDAYTIYTATWWVWGGLEVLDPVDISDPLASASFDALPAPMLLDTTGETFDWIDVPEGQAVRVVPFRYMALSGRSAKARAWPQRFRNDTPSRLGVAAVAQAKLFNPDSWDLWTQSWQVQLEPVADVAGWAYRASTGAADADATGGIVDAADVEDVEVYLKSIEGPLSDEFITH